MIIDILMSQRVHDTVDCGGVLYANLFQNIANSPHTQKRRDVFKYLAKKCEMVGIKLALSSLV